MAQQLHVGTQIDLFGTTVDVYQIERITQRDGVWVYIAHTLAQRAYGMAGHAASARTWTFDEIKAQVAAGRMRLIFKTTT